MKTMTVGIKADKSGLETLAKFAAEKTRFLLLAHVSPDGDALGSMLALGEGLTAIGKKTTMHCDGGVPRMFRFMPGAELVTSDPGSAEDYDAAILLDHNEPERSGAAAHQVTRDLLLGVVDHHLTTGEPPEHAWIDPTFSAVGEMVYHLLRAIGAPLTPSIAANLFVAISTDTGSFSFSNTTAECLEITAELVRAGADPWEMHRQLFLGRSRGRLELLGLALRSLEFHADGRIGMMSVTTEMMARTGTNSFDTDGFVDYPRSVEGVELAVLFREIGPQSCKASLRSLGRFNAAALAQHFGGGGHAQAAGFSADMPLEKLKKMVVELAGQYLAVDYREAVGVR
jgi:phosphoesterase RecJ-like protein